MDNIDAEQEIKRIERELDAKNPPPGKPPTRQANSGGGGDSKGKRDPKKNRSTDAVLVGVVLLLGIGTMLTLGEKLNKNQKIQLSAGAIGAAAGLAIGYGVGRFRP